MPHHYISHAPPLLSHAPPLLSHAPPLLSHAPPLYVANVTILVTLISCEPITAGHNYDNSAISMTHGDE